MSSPALRTLLLLSALVGAVASIGGEEPKSKATADKGLPAKSAAVPEKAPPTTEADTSPGLDLPPGTILAVCDSLAEALRRTPRAVVLSREQYQALQDEIARLRRQLAKPRLLTPAQCLLKGKVDGTLVHLGAEFEFETDQPDTLVRLACGQAQVTAASLDGRAPRLSHPGRPASRSRTAEAADTGREAAASPADGFVVEIDRPGRHALTLDLLLPGTATPTGQGLVLDLPRTAVTRLELELPPGSRDLRLGGRPVGETLLEMKNGRLTGNLGAAERLELSWRTAVAGAASPILTADGTVQVRLEPRQLTTEARLTLRVQSGRTAQWQLLVPAGARVRVGAADEGRVARIETADRKPLTIHTVHLKEPTADPLAVVVEHSQPPPEPGARKPAAIGPFTVLGAVRHTGSVLVSSAVPEWHLEFLPHGDLTRRGVGADELRHDADLTAVFRYGPGNERRAALPWLELEVETVRGQVMARPAHLLRVIDDGDHGPRWQVQTTLTVTPRWADVDRFRVRLPEGCEFNEEGSFPLPERIRSVSHDAAGRTVEFRLARGAAEPSLQPFAVRIECLYPTVIDLKKACQASLPLPRPIGMIEQDGAITVQVPPTLELALPDAADGRPGPPAGLDLVRQSTHDLAFRYARRTPDRLDLAWQPYQAPIRVRSVIDVTMQPGESRVVHELQYQLPATGSPSQVTLQVPDAVAATLEVRQGGRLHGLTAAPGKKQGQLATVTLNGGTAPTLLLAYRTTEVETAPGGGLPIPLVTPVGVSGGEARVRLWSDSGQLPLGAAGWTEQHIEVVPDRPRLPVLVLQATRLDAPLVLQLGPLPPPAALIDRALVRVEVIPPVQTYRVSYRLAHLDSPRLDLELPAPAATLHLQLRLDGKRLDYEALAPEQPEKRGRLIRLRLPAEVGRRPAVLEVSYRLDSDRFPGTALTTPLLAPVVGAATVGVPTRWLVRVPSSWVVLAPEPAAGTPRSWGLRGWLLAPRVGATAADLERWFDGDRPAATEGDEAAGEAMGTPDLVFWCDEAGPVALCHLPQQTWLLACSLALVLLGLVVSRLPLVDDAGQPTAWAWGLLLTGVLLAFLFVLLRPGLAGQLAYGCQPGAVVLAVLAAVQWLLHERYRRQIVFLPSFSRARGGSSVLRPPALPPGEPSTVDVPRALGRPVAEERPASGS